MNHSGNGKLDPTERMLKDLEHIADGLDKLLTGIYICAGLLGIIAFLITLRLMIGR